MKTHRIFKRKPVKSIYLSKAMRIHWLRKDKIKRKTIYPWKVVFIRFLKKDKGQVTLRKIFIV
jgi:hypothetical protein